MASIKVRVPSSSANIGHLFDIGGLALKVFTLELNCEMTFRKKSEGRIIVTANSSCEIPHGRTLGQAGKIAVKEFLRVRGFTGRDFILTYKDGKSGYPIGGLGRSGAEAVAGVFVVSKLLGIQLSAEEIIESASFAEPNHHIDNVAASCLGGLVITKPFLQKIPVHNLGIVVGISSHQKNNGTEGVRGVLPVTFTRAEMVEQTALSTSTMTSLMKNDWRTFFSLLTHLSFHERARADAGCYGRFNSKDLQELKNRLVEYDIGMTISGAGPSMIFFYDTNRYLENAIVDRIDSILSLWLKGIELNIRLVPTQIAQSGAHIV